MMSTMQFSGENIFYTQIYIHSSTHNDDVSLEQQYQKTCMIHQVNIDLCIIAITKNGQEKKV